MIRPPFAYFGGKQKIAQKIVNFLPPHAHYVEPFAGGLSVLLAKPMASMETVNDIDGDIMHFWRILRDRPDELTRVCALTPHARAEHLAAYSRDGVDDIERARRIWVVLSQGRGGQLSRTGWRSYMKPTGGVGMPEYLRSYVERMQEVSARIRHVSLECRPALDVIEIYGKHEEVLLYCDPPYVGSTRGTSNRYAHEMRDEADHAELADALHRTKATVVLSGYASKVYDELYPDWDCVQIPSHTGNAKSTKRTEVLWSNRHRIDA